MPPSCAGFESATFFLFAVLSSGERQDGLFKDEMNAAVKLGGGCAALARMQVPPLRFMHFFSKEFKVHFFWERCSTCSGYDRMSCGM